jgi:hypothetical protein
MKRRPLLFLLFLLVAGVGLFVWKSLRDAGANTFLLADGSQLTFRGITAGTNHSYICGNPLQRLGAWIPGRLGEMLSGGELAMSQGYYSTNLIVWFCIRKNPSMVQFSYVIPGPNGRAKALFRYQLVDDLGHELPDLMSTYSANFPPASPTVRFKLTIWRGPADEEESTEFIAPNPLYRKKP